MNVKWQEYNGHKSDHKGIEIKIKGEYKLITKKRQKLRLFNRKKMKGHTLRMLEDIIDSDSIEEVLNAM